MVERIHQAFHDKVDAVMISAGTWTHYSDGLRDALAILTVPIAKGQICGFGADSYLLGLRAAVASIGA